MQLEKVALFTNARDELHIKEWVSHHLLIGFDHIVVFDHKSKIPLKKVFNNFDKRVKIINSSHLNNPVKILLMNYALHVAKSLKVEWLIYLDCDEFIFFNKPIGVKMLLNNFKHADSVSMNWLLFGSNYLKTEPTGLIIDNYIRSEEFLNKHVKTFSRVNSVIGCVNPHYYDMKNKNKMYNITNFQMSSPYYFFDKKLKYTQVIGYIAHYENQSEETYIKRKIMLPRDDNGKMRKSDLKNLHKLKNNIINTYPKEKYSQNIKNFLLQYPD